jgi:hypothetical protein
MFVAQIQVRQHLVFRLAPEFATMEENLDPPDRQGWSR